MNTLDEVHVRLDEYIGIILVSCDFPGLSDGAIVAHPQSAGVHIPFGEYQLQIFVPSLFSNCFFYLISHTISTLHFPDIIPSISFQVLKTSISSMPSYPREIPNYQVSHARYPE
jgi:hypothetical protein